MTMDSNTGEEMNNTSVNSTAKDSLSIKEQEHSSSVSNGEVTTISQTIFNEALESEDAELSFAEMFAEQEKDQSKAPTLAQGQKVSSKIVAITADTVFVSTGTKVDGIVDREELEVNGELPFAINDVIDLYVIHVSAHEVKLSKVLRGAGNISALEEAKEAALPVEGKVTAQVKGGYTVEIMKKRAFCPGSQIDSRPLDDPDSVIGKTFAFIITKLDKGGRDIVVSRRRLLDAEQAENLDKILGSINVGDVVESTISRFAPFGAFVEIAPGIEGLVHLSELSWARVAQADEVVSLGDRVRVKVLSIDKGDKGVRFSLSMKAVTEDPWKTINGRLNMGDTVTGKVIRLAPFGAFVEVLPGIEGLVHLSEFSYEKRVMKAEEIVVVGDIVAVKIKEIDLEKKRISLSIKDIAGDPWSSLDETFTVGQEVMGTVEKKAQFGIFISIAPGITGLLPASSIQASASKKELERLNSGDPISVCIQRIDLQNHRISLAPVGEDLVAEEESNWKEHRSKEKSKPSEAPVGILGVALQAAMQKKKK